MKTITFLLLTIFTVTRLYSQSYEIDFAGTGDTSIIDSIKVENLNRGISLTLKENDVLKLNIITGIHKNDFDIKSLQVYPNPMADHAEIQFFVIKSINVIVAVYDISGRSVTQSNKYLCPGMHKFRVSGLYQGIYIVGINEQNSFYTAKLISQNRLYDEAKIEYVSSENKQLNRTQTKQPKSTASIIEMPYYEGERLLFKGMTGCYTTIITDIPTSNETITFDFKACTDIDGNNYPVVKIGSQLWMAENLKVTHYRNSDTIPNITNNTEWENLTTGAYCNYENNANNANTYGRFYNWYAVNDSRNIAPEGWHVPSDAEWRTLEMYLGMSQSDANKLGLRGTYEGVGGKLKESSTEHWANPNEGATNESGFSVLPGGYRDVDIGGGAYYSMGYAGGFWTSTKGYDFGAWYRALYNYCLEIERYICSTAFGASVRCVRD